MKSRPFRAVLRWQAYVTGAAILASGLWLGSAGAISAGLGGAINLVAVAVFGWLAARGKKSTAGETLYILLRAEAAKVALIVVLLWLSLSLYKHLELLAFFGTFIVTTLITAAAIIVSDGQES